MDDNKDFMSQYIIKIIITIVDIIMMSLYSTKVLELCCYYDTDNFSLILIIVTLHYHDK